MIKIIIVLSVIICNSIHQEMDDDDQSITKIKNTTIQKTVFNYEMDPNFEDFYPFYYRNDDNASESSVHSNRILECIDHSGAKNICVKANTSSICYEKETFAFSFCRKSCKYCDTVDSIKHTIWRIVAGSAFKPTWGISELLLYSKYPVKPEPLPIIGTFSSSHYDGFPPENIYDNNNETYWIPDVWGQHESNADWIAVRLQSPMTINAIKIVEAKLEGSSPPTRIHIESSNSLNENFIRRWTVNMEEINTESIIVKPLCPPLWHRISGYNTTLCVKVVYKHTTWEQAHIECLKHNSNLISFENINHLRELLNKISLRGRAWIGLNDIEKEGQFVWSDGGKIDYLNWETGMPTDELRSNEEDCTYMKHDGRFETANCRDHLFSICQKPYEKFVTPKFDQNEPDVFSPILTLPDDFSEPVMNTTESYMKLLNLNISWPKAFKIPINTSSDQFYGNRTNNEHKIVYLPRDNNETKEFYPASLRTLPEKEKNEQPIHRVIEIKRTNLHKKEYKKTKSKHRKQ